jgi:hypothetical protein
LLADGGDEPVQVAARGADEWLIGAGDAVGVDAR